MCCYNRPYDDQTQARIRLEADAKMLIQQKIKTRECALLWSSTLDFELSNNPFEDHRLAIAKWRPMAEKVVMATHNVIEKAHEFARQGLRNYDALHLASAQAGEADVFVTTDDRLYKKTRGNVMPTVMVPGEALAFLEKWYED